MTFQESLAALRDDRRNVAILDIAMTFAVLAAMISLLALFPGPWSYVFAFAGIGLMQYRIVIACHEAVHKTLLFPLWLNETIGGFHCALVGVNLASYRRQHLAHHAAQNIGQDTDAYIYAPILRAKPGWRRLAVWVFGTGPELIQKVLQKGLTAGATVEASGNTRIHSLAIVAAQGALLASSMYWLTWWHYFVFWLGPLLTIAAFINRTRVLVEHGYAHATGDASMLGAAPMHSIDFSANALGRFFIAPFGFSYHAAHHRAPSIPCYRNPDLFRLIEQQGEAAVRPSYAQALRHVLWDCRWD
jgi:fatty acid desaturase